jgi:hypothetical protein
MRTWLILRGKTTIIGNGFRWGWRFYGIQRVWHIGAIVSWKRKTITITLLERKRRVTATRVDYIVEFLTVLVFLCRYASSTSSSIWIG